MLIDLFPQYKQVIQETAMQRYPEECVFLITEKDGLYEVDNVNQDPCNSFSISRKDTKKAFDNGLITVIHSHPDAEEVPSMADMIYQKQCNVTFGILSCTENTCSDIVYFGNNVNYDLNDRPFIHGVTDCYSYVRDFYNEKLNIDLPDFNRDWDWWDNSQNMYLDNVAATGFTKVDEPQYGDMVIACILSDVPNHAGVYLGDEMIGHHIGGKDAIDVTRLPKQESIHRFKKYIHSYWRHNENT